MAEHPEWVYGFNAGVHAAWERAMETANAIPADPATYDHKMMWGTVMDLAAVILELKRRTPGSEALYPHQSSDHG